LEKKMCRAEYEANKNNKFRTDFEKITISENNRLHSSNEIEETVMRNKQQHSIEVSNLI